MEIRNDLYDEIKSYCEMNEISDVDDFVHKLLIKGFNLEKYGDRPNIQQPIKISGDTTEVVDSGKTITYRLEIGEKTVKKTDNDLYGEK